MARKKNEMDRAIDRALRYMNAIEGKCPTLTKCGRNLTRLALQGKLDKVYHRDTEIINIQKILLRKSKANVLLTGPAGCGKTAIAEHLAQALALRMTDLCQELNRADLEYEMDRRAYNDDPGSMEEPTLREVPRPILSKSVIFDVSLTALVGGTKYRGEFEERVQALIAECKECPQVILFIDEIHQIIKAGATEGNEGAAQMLKPAMARKDICVIGATTTDEAETIWKDKAFARRFNEIKVLPLIGEKARTTAESIFEDYAKFHDVKVDATATAMEILEKISYFLPKSVFPDNFINVVDETLAGAKFDGLTEVGMTHFNAVLSRMAGVVIV